MIEEVDLFYKEWKKPIIAVTGTVGKTSVVHLLSEILAHNGKNVATGGNIGTAMLDLLSQTAEYALLELSSFQLERADAFTPEIAIITNIYNNHLDRHGTFEKYVLAKCNLIKKQTSQQKTLVPWVLRTTIRALTDRPIAYFSCQAVTPQDVAELHPHDTLYTLQASQVHEDNEQQCPVNLVQISRGGQKLVYGPITLPALSHRENWLVLLATCDLLSISNEALSLPPVTLPAHRLEKLRTKNDITFYNDSKATIIESTLAAVEQLNSKKIHLLLGGLSKGVDRSSLMQQFKGKVASIICFGHEAEILYEACQNSSIPVYKNFTLEDAFNTALTVARPGDIVLFSPSGSSYDLYNNYKERGDAFAALVKQL